MKVLWLFIKSFFVCLHLPHDLSVDKRLEMVYDDGEYEDWKCECTCKCGEKVEYTFSFMNEDLKKRLGLV